MSATGLAAMADQLEELEERASECRFQVQYAGELLKLLAETMTGRHVGYCGDPDYAPWAAAEYLADQLAAHAATLGEAMNDLQKLAMTLKKQSKVGAA